MRFDGRFLPGVALVACSLIFCSCTTMKSAQPAAARQMLEKPDDVDGYLAYYRYVSNMSGEELKKEYMAVNQAYIKDKNNQNRLQLALLLSLQNANFKDSSKALVLLKEYLATGANDNTQLRDFAMLLSAYVAENKRQEEKLKAELNRNEEQDRKLEELKGRLKTEQSRSNELEQKLEALKGIEKSINERQQSQPVITR